MKIEELIPILNYNLDETHFSQGSKLKLSFLIASVMSLLIRHGVNEENAYALVCNNFFVFPKTDAGMNQLKEITNYAITFLHNSKITDISLN